MGYKSLHPAQLGMNIRQLMQGISPEPFSCAKSTLICRPSNVFPLMLFTAFLASSTDSNSANANLKQKKLISIFKRCQFTTTKIMHPCTLWTKKRWQYIKHHNSGKTRSIFIIFANAVSRKKRFTQSWKICPPHLNNVLMLPCEN